MTLCQSLERRGVKCWISARDILAGENFQVAIVQAIRNARILLLVFTANSNNSEEMTKELALASQQKMIVIPLRVEDVTPSDAFAYEFATRQWIDAFADWEFAIDQLVQRISSALASASPAPLAAAPEPAHPPAPTVLALGDIVRKAKAGAAHAPEQGEPAAEPVEAAEAEEPPPAKRAINPLLLVAAAVAAVVGLGVVVPSLMNARTKPATPMLAVARLQTAEAAPAAQMVAAPPAPVAEAVVEEEKPVAPPPKRKRKPQPEVHSTDIPY